MRNEKISFFQMERCRKIGEEEKQKKKGRKTRKIRKKEKNEEFQIKHQTNFTGA